MRKLAIVLLCALCGLLIVVYLLRYTRRQGSAGKLPHAAATTHRPLAPGAIAVTAPGNLDKPGATYQLMNDVTSETTALFLAKDVTLDLNGYTITYAKGPYEHVANGGFEEDFKGWDVTGAPGAKVEDAGGNWPFVEKKVCRLPKGEELVSSFVTLPLADRSWYAMVGMLTDEEQVTVAVEDEKGNPVEYEQRVGDKVYKNCPITAGSKLDGGVVYAHFRGKPAGKYRVRVKAGKSDLVIDRVDIRPSLDVGVAIAGSGWVYANYNQVAWGGHIPAFVDYMVKDTYNQMQPGIPSAKGNARIVIKNGVIRSGFDGIHTWGIQSVGAEGEVVLEHLVMISSGINANQVLARKAVIRKCRFETDTEFIIERHNLPNSPVALTAADGSEVAECEFIGGQGNLYVNAPKGEGVKVHDNLFVNRQRVTNHYALSIGGSRGVEVWGNRFEADIGCSIELFRSKDCIVRNNTINVNAVDPSCKFYRGAGTITGVRITDYNAKRDDPRGCWGNKVHDNVFRVTGKSTGRACAIFYSSGAGKNEVCNNEMIIDHKDPKSDALATGFYVGAADFGGDFRGNRITTNVPAFHVAAGYGEASNVVIAGNTFIKGPNAPEDFQFIRMGFWKLVAQNVEFRSNTFENFPFGIVWGNTDTLGRKTTYSVSWTLTVKARPNEEIVIIDKDGKEALRKQADAAGVLAAELPEYSATVEKTAKDYVTQKTFSSPYTVKYGNAAKSVTLDRNVEVNLMVP